MAARTVRFYLETVATGDGISKTRGELEEFERRSEALTTRISNQFQSVGKSLTNAGRSMTTFVSLPIAAGFATAIKSASDLNESISAANVVFEENRDTVQKWSKTMATSFGIARADALEAASGFQNFFRNAGIASDTATDMSTSMVELAGDMASFHNQDPTEMLDKIRSGLAGEVEPLRRFGINLSAAAVSAKAVEMGLAGSTSEVTQAGKVQAAYALILEQTQRQQGDFARTSDGVANQQRILKARLQDSAAALGNQLLPIVQKAAEFFTGLLERFNALNPSMQRFILIGAAILAVLGPVVGAVGALLTVLGLILSPVGLVIAAIAALAVGVVYAYKRFEGFRDVVDAVVSWFRDTAIPAFVKAGEWIMQRFEAVREWWEGFWPKLSEAVRHFTNVVHGIIDFFVNIVTALWDRFGSLLIDRVRIIWTMIYDFIAGALGTIRGVIDFFLAIINGEWGQAWEAIKTIFSNIWQMILALLTGFLSTLHNMIFLVWEGIKAVIGNAWAFIRDQVLSPIGDWLQRNVIDKFWAVKDGIMGAMDAIWTGMVNVWRNIMAAIRGPVNAIIGFVNSLINGMNTLLNQIPGVNFSIPTIPTIPDPFGGGGATAASSGGASSARMAAGGRIGAGFTTSGPRAIVGEGHPSYPEFVIPTDPRYSSRALGLFSALGDRLMPRMAWGGVLGDWFSSGKDWIGGLVSSAGGYLGDLTRQALSGVFAPVNAMVKAGLDKVPNILGLQSMAQGIREAIWNWVQGADTGLPEAPRETGPGGSPGAGRLVGYAAAAFQVFRNMFPNMTIGGWRATGSVPGSDHPKGKALDLMTRSNAVAQQIISVFLGQAGRKYWIWNRQIANAPGFDPRPYRGPSPHTDHVHLSYYRNGGIVDGMGITHPGEMVLTRADQVGLLKQIRSHTTRSGGTVVNVAPGAVVINARPGREGERDAERAAKRFLDVIDQRRVLTDARVR